jgi:hypothetical protein
LDGGRVGEEGAVHANSNSRSEPTGGNKRELSSAQKAKLRIKDEELQQLQEIGALRRQPLARFRTVDFQRKVNLIALEAAGISETEIQAIQQEFDRAWMDTEKLISQNATVTAPKSIGDPYILEVKAEVEKGNEFLSSLKKRLEERYGSKAAEILLSGYDDGRLLGSFGRQNQRIEVRYDEDNRDWRVTFSNSNPLTGEVTLRGRSFPR